MLKDILDFIIDLESNKDSDAFAVNFMGGEPLLKKELIYQAVNYIKEKCKKKSDFKSVPHRIQDGKGQAAAV